MYQNQIPLFISQKITAATWSINRIIPVSIALLQGSKRFFLQKSFLLMAKEGQSLDLCCRPNPQNSEYGIENSEFVKPYGENCENHCSEYGIENSEFVKSYAGEHHLMKF